MMQEIIVRPLLLILLLAVSQRNSCANPIASRKVHGEIEELVNLVIHIDNGTIGGEHIYREIVNGMTGIELTEFFIKIVNRLNVNGNITSPTVRGAMEEVHTNTSSSTVYGTRGEVHTNISGPTVYDATEDVPINISCSKVNDIMKGLKRLKNTFSWLQGKVLLGSDLSETMQNLSNDLSNIPRRINFDYINDRVIIVKSVLEHAAIKTREWSEYGSRIHSFDTSEEVLKYTIYQSKQILEFGNYVLKNALDIFIEIKDALSNTEEYLNKMKENTKEIQPIITPDRIVHADALYKALDIPPAPIPIGQNDPTRRFYSPKFNKQYKQTTNIERENKLLSKINKARDSISTVLTQIVEINDYLTESERITKHYYSSEASISNHEAMSTEAIESSLTCITEGLTGIKNASTNFLNHISS